MTLSREFDRLRVLLVRTRNPLNIGAAARAMSNFGFLRLRLVSPYAPAFREARSAVGAAPVLAGAKEYASISEAVGDCALVVGTTAVGNRKLRQDLKLLPEGAEQIRERLAVGKVALLFGSEKVGLSNKDLAHCHWLLHIPTRTEHTSMNLGQAVAVCLYELVRNRAVQAISDDGAPASAVEVERIESVLLATLRASGYEAPGAAASTEKKVRRLLRDIRLRQKDALQLLGMVRQIDWKLRQKEKSER